MTKMLRTPGWIKVSLACVFLGGLLGCAKPTTIVATPAETVLTPKPNVPHPGSTKPTESISQWRFFCIDGQTRSNILTFQGEISNIGHPNHLLVRDEKMLPILDIRRLHPLTFSKLFGVFAFTGKKLDTDTIRMNPDRTSLHLAEMDFFKNETFPLGDFTLPDLPKPFVAAHPWAVKKLLMFGWNPQGRTLLVPGTKEVWHFAFMKDFSERPAPHWSMKEYFNPMYWNKRWVWWHWTAATGSGQLEAWDITGNAEARFKKSLWSRGQLFEMETSDQWLTALFVDQGGLHWIVADRDLKIRVQRKLSSGEWLTGIDPELKRPWVALGQGANIRFLEYSGTEVKETTMKVPLRSVEVDATLGQMAKFKSNILVQLIKGENRFWKRKSGDGWTNLENLDCKDLSYVKDTEAR